MKSDLLAPLFCTAPHHPRNTGSGLSSGWCFTWVVRVSFFSFQKSKRISHPSFFLWSWSSDGGPRTCDEGVAEQRSFPWLPRCPVSGPCPWKGSVRRAYSSFLIFLRLLLFTHWVMSPLSVEFFRQEYCSGLPFPSPEDLLDPGIEPTSLIFVGRFFTIWAARGYSLLFIYLWCDLLFVLFFLRKYNCFAMSCWFLLYNAVSQPHIYTHPLSVEPPSHPPSQPARSSQSTELSSLCCTAGSH